MSSGLKRLSQPYQSKGKDLTHWGVQSIVQKTGPSPVKIMNTNIYVFWTEKALPSHASQRKRPNPLASTVRRAKDRTFTREVNEHTHILTSTVYI
jgi:hypothetical protein